MIIGLLSILSISSCLGDNDDDNGQDLRELTATEKEIAVGNTAGEYDGWFYFINEDYKLDSLKTTTDISSKDSLVTITIPPAALIPGLKRQNISEQNLDVFSHAPNIIFTCVIHPYYNQYWNAGDYTFIYSYPNNVLTQTFTVDGTDHIVEYKFSDYINSGGIYYNRLAEYYNNVFFCNVLFEYINVDGLTYTLNTSTTFEGKRI